jgi:hypothetical protein
MRAEDASTPPSSAELNICITLHADTAVVIAQPIVQPGHTCALSVTVHSGLRSVRGAVIMHGLRVMPTDSGRRVLLATSSLVIEAATVER